ncbi:MAG TPA: polyprenyl diphosphate synthase [Dehalococcoidales bacterium]|nr:polyprenyl diphosphate synthase [Dehalococcoidales bacterium]
MTVLSRILPRHVAIIMDGNGRWAEKRGLQRSAGHLAGYKRIRSVVATILKHQIPYLTIFSFSTENWNRPADEVQALLTLLIDNIESESAALHQQNVRIHHIGRLSGLSNEIQTALQKACHLTRDNQKLVFSLAFNYGGQAEITDAFKSMAKQNLRPEDINETTIENHLNTAGIPPVDLLIRTGGELRISNFLLWQSAYAEFYFTRVLWPDFTPGQVEKALNAFSQRKRRFGKIG